MDRGGSGLGSLFAWSSPETDQPQRPWLPRGSLRRDLWASTADGAAYSVMVGCGETYIPAFALALGLGPVAAGMTASLPVLAGACFQLVTPLAVHRLRSNRGWVVWSTVVQALSFLPLAWWALRGHAQLWELLVAVSIYWAAGMAGVPAWNAWMGTLVPERMRTPYFAHRHRLSQFGVLGGFVSGGLLLQWGQTHGVTLATFAALFTLAGLCRLVSTACLAICRELKPPGFDALPTSLSAPEMLETSAAARPEIVPGETVDDGGAEPLWARLTALVRSPSGTLVCYLWAVAFACQFTAPYFTPYMLRELDLSYEAYMLIVATSFLAKALALPSLGRLGAKLGPARLLGCAGLAIIPLSLLWIPSANIGYLMAVQVLAGTCWAGYELAMSLLFFAAVPPEERTGVVTAYNLGQAIATVAGAAAGGLLLRSLGEDQTAYFALFAVSSLLRLATIPLLLRFRATGLQAVAKTPPARG
ncbi:MAG: MFS transporter [Planctomycetota bacterium]